MNTAPSRFIVPCLTKARSGFAASFFHCLVCLAVFALFMGTPCFAPGSAEAASPIATGGGNGDGVSGGIGGGGGGGGGLGGTGGTGGGGGGGGGIGAGSFYGGAGAIGGGGGGGTGGGNLDGNHASGNTGGTGGNAGSSGNVGGDGGSYPGMIDGSNAYGGGGGGAAGQVVNSGSTISTNTSGGKGGDSTATGGGGGGAGVLVTGGSSLTITGTGSITGGAGGKGGNVVTGSGGGGGAGLAAINDITVTNQSHITGGAGGNGGINGGGGGGTGVFLSAGGSLTNEASAVITGGAGGNGGGDKGGDGGDGLRANNANISNVGTIQGGNGGDGIAGDSAGGRGGNGLYVYGGSTATTINNTGSILGGNGGTPTGNGGRGAGGAGVRITGSGYTLANAGAISGGNSDNGLSGVGGAGVLLEDSGNTLINAGAISGGTGNAFARANAVTITGTGNTVELHNGYSFTGNVVATGTGHTLRLGGTDNESFDASRIKTVAGQTDAFDGFDTFEKTGASTWTLTGTDTNNTSWTVQAGTLKGNTYTFTADQTVNAGAFIEFDQSANGTYSNAIDGTGSLTKTGAGTLTLSGANTYSGGTTVTAGTLAGDTTSLQGSITNNAQVEFNQTGTGTYAGVMDGSGSLTKTGAGTLTLSGTNAYTGDTTVSAGGLTVTGTLGSGTYAGAIANSGSLIFDQTANQALSGIISGTGSLTKTGAGTLTLSGANTYSGMTEVRAGTLALTGSLASNLLTLHDGTTFDASSGGTHSLDSGALHVHGQAAYNGNLLAQNALLNFYVPTTMSSGATMLTVDGTADITDSAVNVGIEGGSSPLATGDTLTLIDSTGLSATGINTTANGRGMQGVTLLYEFDILADSDKLFATVTSIGVNPQLKSLSEGRAAGMAFVNQGSDLMLGSGMGAMMAASQSAQGAFVPFAVGMGGSSRYNTGSHVDVDGFSMMTGLAWRQPVNEGKNGSFLAGAFFEAGWGNYDSHNSFNNAASVKGDGDISYYGGGLLGRYDFAPSAILGGSGNIYVDASFRAGHVSTDFSSSDLVDGAGRSAEYDSGSAYYGAHAGLGYLWNITERASLDLSTRYIWTHQNSDSVKVLGDPVKFKASDSQRWRTGARFAYAINEYVAPYAGAYYDHEFDGKAKASTNGYAIDAPDLKGGTGVGELGFTLKPSQTLPLSFDVGVQGYTGVREGVSGSLQVKFEF